MPVMKAVVVSREVNRNSNVLLKTVEVVRVKDPIRISYTLTSCLVFR
jgi:hypothetical protein